MVGDWLTRLAAALRTAVIRAMPVATVVLDAASHLVAAAWRVVRRPVLFAVNVILALLLLFEEWGWQPLVALLGQLARFRLWARMEVWIAGLPPYGALVVFALPTLILFPLKVAGVWLLANGHVLTAGALLFAAKIASTAFIARAFLLTKPALMRIAWFRWAYERFVPWKDALFAQIRASWAWRYGRMVKTRVKLETKRAWLRWKPPLEAVWARAKTGVRKGLARVRVAALAFWQRWGGAERL
jgi:hypothetical protein